MGLSRDDRDELMMPIRTKRLSMFGEIGYRQMFRNFPGQQLDFIIGKALEAAFEAGAAEARASRTVELIKIGGGLSNPPKKEETA